jgi:hypothetical protein
VPRSNLTYFALVDCDVPDLDQFLELSPEAQVVAHQTLLEKQNKDGAAMTLLKAMEAIMKQAAKYTEKVAELTIDNNLKTEKVAELTIDNNLKTEKVAELTIDNNLKTEKVAELTKEIVDTNVLTGDQFCSKLRFRRDCSTSTAHFHKDAPAVIHDVDEELLIDMPPEFYKCRCFPCFESTFLLGEADTEKAFNILVDAVIQALRRIGYLPENFILVTSSQVNLLDAIPDIGLFAGANRYLCGVIEVKKSLITF